MAEANLATKAVASRASLGQEELARAIKLLTPFLLAASPLATRLQNRGAASAAGGRESIIKCARLSPHLLLC